MNSRCVSGSISFCRMESDSSLMEASGVFSSWDASETNCRRRASELSSLAASSLKARLRRSTSSCPRTGGCWE